MLTSLFDFSLPDSHIATAPANPRDSARLLCVTSPACGGGLVDRLIRDLPSLLQPGDLLVFNDTKVIPARLSGKRGEAKVEVMLLKSVIPAQAGIHLSTHSFGASMDSRLRGNDTIWTCFAKPAKKLRIGDTVIFAPELTADVIEKKESGEVLLRFNINGAAFDAALARHGSMPLPPYIAGKRAPDATDNAHYQTIYAANPGAVAAPTAGLHFTPELFRALEEKSIGRAFVTLHVGAGTFLPVKAEDTRDHRMHSEWYSISDDTAAAITRTKQQGGRVVAVGTTSLRTLESAAAANGEVTACSGDTDIFITPGYRFKCVDTLLTNFHLPKSTLFMLVCAFAGTENMKRAYNHAIASGYRFYSYGDACLLEKAS